jgi:glutathionylspermidine synthase
VTITPRSHWAERLESQGLSFHSREQYWNEAACYEFTAAEVDTLETATAELHRICIDALRHLVAESRLGKLMIPPAFWDAVAASVHREEFSLYGRMDLAFDGQSHPKLLEYNADTPTSLLESAVCQWFWLQDCYPKSDQFNSIHERLIARWRQLPGTGPIHLASLADNEEDWVCITYLMDTVVQAGRAAQQLNVEDIGVNESQRRFLDLQGAPIDYLFKLYPWEWMLRESFAPHLIGSGTQFIEPLWKMVLSCKGLLPILWELNPGHPNLLPAFFEPDQLSDYARKPLYSREGANVELYSGGRCLQQAGGEYGAEGYIYQALQPLPEFAGYHPVIGSWLVAGEPAGIGIREDRSLITGNTSHFVPHYFT